MRIRTSNKIKIVSNDSVSDKVGAIILIFHNLAPHNGKIHTATKDCLSDRELVEKNDDMIDLVFWNGEMYDCDANTKAITKLKQIAKQQF